MVNVSRLELDHPALGTAGGAGLHTSIENIYKKIGDAVDSRYFTAENLANAASVDFDHNFNTAIGNLRYDLYTWNTGTGELTLVTNLTGWTIAAKVGSEKTHITVTNGTGSEQDIAFVVINDPIHLDELADVDLTGAANTHVLTREAGIWVSRSPTSKVWQYKTADYGASAKESLLVNNSGGAVVITLPATPTLGDFVEVADAYGTFDDELLCIVNANGGKINGSTDPYDCDIPGKIYTFIYIDATRGWSAFIS